MTEGKDMDQAYRKPSGGELSKLGGSLALRAGLAASLMGMPLVAQAQEAVEDDVASADEAGNGALLEQVVVGAQGLGQVNTNAAAASSSRLPGSMRDVPQTVNVIPERVLLEQNVSTLEQALANVPGITVAVGEGRGGMQGDRFRIRGFETFGDTYRDGLRDFGVYIRDSFNMEQIEVFKGPNGENFGVGTTGGAINAGSKRARLGTFGTADASYGNGPLKRTTVDYNWQFGETSALRFNAMGHWQDIADRDYIFSDRWGVAASLGLGLGSDQTLHIDYMFQRTERISDYGIPMVALNVGERSRPVSEYGVPRSNYYGKTDDVDDSDVHLLTVSYKNDINEWLTVHNDTRYSHYDRFFAATPPNCSNAAACRNALNSGGTLNPTLGFTGGGGPAYDQTSWGLQNIATAIAKFELGGLRHEAVFGLDFIYQDDARSGYASLAGSKANPTLYNPIRDYALYGQIDGNWQESHSYNVALFASDRLWFNDQWSVMGGLRWENQKTKHKTGPVGGIGPANLDDSWSENWVSPKASLIWEPTSSQNYYLSWSVTHNVPSGQNVSSEIVARTMGFAGWDPEKSELFELGTKLDFLDGNLGITAAIFQLEKNNTYDRDAGGSLVYSGDARRVRGFEAGVTGQLTVNWNIYASYTYLDSEITSSGTAANIGKSVEGVAKNAATLWTTYDIAPHLDIGNGKLLIGGGIKYRDAMKINAAGTSAVPHSLSLDGMVSYETEKWNMSLNAYNLTDRINYDAYFGNRSIPSSGRSFVVKVGTKF